MSTFIVLNNSNHDQSKCFSRANNNSILYNMWSPTVFYVCVLLVAMNAETWTSKYCPVLSLEGVHTLCRLHGQLVSCEFLTVPGTKVTLTCKDSYKILLNDCDPANREITCLDGECRIVVADGCNITANGSLVEHSCFPWHVTIYEKSSTENFEPIFAGTLVSSNLVILAAHCFFNRTVNKALNTSGISNWYNKHKNEQLRSANSGMTARWGTKADGTPNDVLQEVHSPFIPFKRCLTKAPENLKRSITADKFCAGYLNGSRFCTSDSGSGLYFLFQGVCFLRGITSLNLVSSKTTDRNDNTLFTNVGRFLKWICDVYVSTGNGLSRGNDPDSDDGTYHNYDAIPDEYGSCPWRQLEKHYSDGVAGLHEEIEDFFTYMRLTAEEHELRLRVIRRIKDVISDLWPNSEVLLFGSYRTGLLLPTSDIDLQVMGVGPMSPLRTLEKTLLDRSIAKQTSIEVIDKARVPIVRFTDKETEIKLDISFPNDIHTGRGSVELIESYKRQFPMLEKLVMVLKQFLVQRDLNKVFTGGISSYSLVLMTINFLQLHPRLNEYGPNANLGSLLIEFLELYGRKFNYVENCIRVNDGGAYIPKNHIQCHMTDEHVPSLLCIENPFIAGNSISCRSYRTLHLKEAFDQAYSILSQAVSSLNIPVSDANKLSVLGRIIRVPDDMVEYRKWIKETFPLPGGETDSLLSPIGSDASTFSGASDVEYSRGNSSDNNENKNKKIEDRRC